jgi:uncharacterized protein (DUF488 family)
MNLYTIGFSKKTAEEFFESLKKYAIALVVDIRLNNKSQLSGFAKYPDLKYFLSLFGIRYYHAPILAPTQQLLKSFRSGITSWVDYKNAFLEILNLRKDQIRQIFLKLDGFEKEKICFLCSENEYKQCHRSLVVDFLQREVFKEKEIRIFHILKNRKGEMVCVEGEF